METILISLGGGLLQAFEPLNLFMIFAGCLAGLFVGCMPGLGSVNGPPGMDPEAVEWYTNLFGELFASQEWQDFCTSDGLTCADFMNGAELATFHENQVVAHKALIEQVGAEAITGE